MSSTPTEYGSASLATASAPDDDVSTASDDVTGDCGDAGELTAALLPAVNKKYNTALDIMILRNSITIG